MNIEKKRKKERKVKLGLLLYNMKLEIYNEIEVKKKGGIRKRYP